MPATNCRWYLDPEPFICRLEEWLERQNGGEDSKNASCERLPSREFIALHMGVTRAWVDKFLSRGIGSIHFDRADALMCAMNVAHEWLTEETFCTLYEGIDFKGLDDALPCDGRVKPPRRSFDYEEALRLYESGLKYKEIGSRFGVSYWAVQSAIHRLKEKAQAA